MTIQQVREIGATIEKLKIDVKSCHKPYCEDGFGVELEKVFIDYHKKIMDIISKNA